MIALLLALAGSGLFVIGTIAPTTTFAGEASSLIGFGIYPSKTVAANIAVFWAPIVVAVIGAILGLVSSKFTRFAAGAALAVGVANLAYLLALFLDLYFDADPQIGLSIATGGSVAMTVGGILIVFDRSGSG